MQLTFSIRRREVLKEPKIPDFVDRWPALFDVKEDMESSELDTAARTMAIFTVRAADGDASRGRFANVGVIIEGVEVLNNLESVNQACVMLYGLIYALNLTYPVSLKYSFEFYQKILMDLDAEKPSPKVRTLKGKLLK